MLRVAAKNGSVAEESAWLNEQAPGILDVDQYPAPTKYRLAQIVALEAWYTTLSPEELSRRIDLLEEIGEGLGFDPFKDLKVVVQTSQAARVVPVPGPPPVSTYTKSKTASPIMVS